jgi:hypothetical protein
VSSSLFNTHINLRFIAHLYISNLIKKPQG